MRKELPPLRESVLQEWLTQPQNDPVFESSLETAARMIRTVGEEMQSMYTNICANYDSTALARLSATQFGNLTYFIESAGLDIHGIAHKWDQRQILHVDVPPQHQKRRLFFEMAPKAEYHICIESPLVEKTLYAIIPFPLKNTPAALQRHQYRSGH